MDFEKQIETERKLLQLEADMRFINRTMEASEEAAKDTKTTLAKTLNELAELKLSIGKTTETLQALQANPFLAFTATLDIKKTITIIIVITSVISSLSTFDLLFASKNSDRQQIILDKLESLLDD